MKTIVIAAANGFLGSCLSQFFLEEGWRVVGLVRSRKPSHDGVELLEWDGETLQDSWVNALEGADLLVNLTGRSVNCRYHTSNRKDILESRTRSTALLGEAITMCKKAPKVWINSSTATIYRHAEDRPQGELDGELGEGFSVEVARAWENAFYAAKVDSTVRKVAIRTAIVMGEQPGTVWTVLQSLARLGMGGRMGNGRQMVSWLHVDDFCRAVLWLSEKDGLSGSVNLAAPNPVTNEELMRLVRQSVGKTWAIPVPRWALEFGAFLRRTETELVLKSRWVLPTRLQQEGFTFKYPNLETSLAQIAVD